MARRRPKSKAKRPVSQAQARLFGVVARKGSTSARKMRPGEMSRPEARSTLRGVAVRALPPRKRTASKPTPTKPKPAAKPRPKRRPSTAAQRAARRKRNARRAAGL